MHEQVIKRDSNLYFFKMIDQKINQSVKGSQAMNYSMIPQKNNLGMSFADRQYLKSNNDDMLESDIIDPNKPYQSNMREDYSPFATSSLLIRKSAVVSKPNYALSGMYDFKYSTGAGGEDYSRTTKGMEVQRQPSRTHVPEKSFTNTISNNTPIYAGNNTPKSNYAGNYTPKSINITSPKEYHGNNGNFSQGQSQTANISKTNFKNYCFFNTNSQI